LSSNEDECLMSWFRRVAHSGARSRPRASDALRPRSGRPRAPAESCALPHPHVAVLQDSGRRARAAGAWRVDPPTIAVSHFALAAGAGWLFPALWRPACRHTAGQPTDFHPGLSRLPSRR
ncbi:MAG: hypothetical protein SGPRY_009922, partial [Prymnesium sp.]